MEPEESWVGEEAAPSGGEAAERPAAEVAEDSENSEAPEDESEGEAIKETAERWKKVLTTKYGVYPWRVVVLEGRRMQWSAGRLTGWLVPEKARWPDPQARDEDDVDEQ